MVSSRSTFSTVEEISQRNSTGGERVREIDAGVWVVGWSWGKALSMKSMVARRLKRVVKMKKPEVDEWVR